MGRYKAERIIIRDFESDVMLVFYDQSSIYMLDKKEQQWSVFHKYYASLGTYRKNWLPFRKALLRTKELDALQCYQLAYRYNIQYMCNNQSPPIEEKKVELKFKNWSIRGEVDV